MNEVEYQIKIRGLIKRLSPEKLRDKLLSVAYNVPSDRWDDFISYFDDDFDETLDNDVIVIKDEFDNALLFLDELIEEKIYLKRVYKRSSDLVDDYHIEDPYNVEEQLHGVFEMVDRFLNDKEFSKALAIYSKLKELYIPVQDAEYDMLLYSLEEYYSDSNKYEEDISYIGSRALVCIYSLSGNLNIKVKKFNDYLNSPLCRSVTAEHFIRESDEHDKGLEDFLLMLLLLLFKTPGSKSIEWIYTIAPIKILGNNIEKSYKIHPRLFRILMQKCIENKQYKEAIKVGTKALELMDVELIERSKVANLLISDSLYLRGLIDKSDIYSYYYTTASFQLEEKEILFLFDRFESRSTLNNFLSLYRNIGKNYHFKNRLVSFLTNYNSNLVNEDEDNEFITNVIHRDVFSLAAFLLNPGMKSLNILKSRYGSYDREYRNVMVNVFLLFLARNDKEPSYLSSIAPNQNEIGYSYNLYVKFNLDFDFELINAILNWIGEVVSKLTQAVIENGEERYYLRTAKLIKGFNDVLLKYNLAYKNSRALDYYNSKYSNVEKFIELLNSF